MKMQMKNAKADADSDEAHSDHPGTLWSWAMYDWANSAFSTVILTFLFAAYYTRQVAPSETLGASRWGFALGAGGAIAALGAPLLGALADQTGRRKLWLGAFTAVAVVATALLWFIRPSEEYQWWALLLVCVGALGMGGGLIFYNAMLPALASAERIGRWSGLGWGMGYAGGLACLILALVAFVDESTAWIAFEDGHAANVRATFVLVAVWFAVFSLPLFLFTPDEPATGKAVARVVRDGFRQLGASLGNIRRYRNILRFLVAHLFYMDGLFTLFVYAGVYAAGVFHMTEQEVLRFGIALNVAAGLGALAFARIDDLIGSKRTIALALVGLIFSGGFILVVDSLKWFWVGGIAMGAFVGPAQAASRSMMARMAPPDLRNEMFGLHALSGKVTAFVGPLAVASIIYFTGNQRIGMSAPVVFLTVGFLLLLRVKDPTESSLKH